MECFRLLLEHLAWIEHEFLSGIRDSRKAGSLWRIMRGMAEVRKSIHQSWLTKGLRLRLGLLCWGFKGVHAEIPREEASTLQIGSVAFPPGQSTTPSLSQTIWPRWAPRLFLSLPIVQTLLPVTWLFPKLRGCRYETIEEMKEAVTKVIGTIIQEDFQKLLKQYNKCIAAGGDYFDGNYSFMCVLSIKVPIRKKSGNLFNGPRIYLSVNLSISNKIPSVK